MVAKLIKWAATSANALGQGKGEVESLTEKETKWLRVDPGGPRRGQSSERS